MPVERWDADEAVLRGAVDAPLDGRSAATRYGVTAFEEWVGESLSLALSQEEPDQRLLELDVEEDLEESCEQPSDSEADAPEERAMHVVIL